MDELIDRARRGEATAPELAQLDAWRAESADNERQYRSTLRLLEAGRTLGDSATTIARPTAAEIVAAVALHFNPGEDADTIPGWRPTEVITSAGELATVQLGEGSVVRLAPSSRLRVHAGREREVTLEGRAFFAVEHMARHPLRVHTRVGEARVVGTRFELVTNVDRLDLRVVEGTVALSTQRDHIDVTAGEESGVRNGTVTPPTRVAAPTTVATWVGTFLAFQATPLRDAAREIERVYRTPVT